MREILQNLRVNDVVDIAIYDCCEGIADVLGVEEEHLTICFQENLFTMCYPNSHLASRTMRIPISEIAELSIHNN